MKKQLFFALTILLTAALFPAQMCRCHAYTNGWEVYTRDSGLSSDHITALSVDPGGYVWASAKSTETAEGSALNIIEQSGGIISPYPLAAAHGSPVIHGVEFTHIGKQHKTDFSYGKIWFATDRGLAVLDRKGELTTLTAANSPLPGNTVPSIFIDSENTIWVSVWGRGVCCIDSEFNWTTHTVSEGLCSRYVLSIYADRNGDLWFGSKSRGVSCFTREKTWINFSSGNSGLIANEITDIAEEPPNKLWMVTPSGISVFDGQNWMSFTQRNSPLSGSVPSAIEIDSAGNKWIGTRGGGLFKLDGFGMWTRFDKHNSALPENNINDLTLDNQGGVWAGTTAGLCRISTAHGVNAGARQYGGESLPAPASPRHFSAGLIWKNIDQSDQPAGLSLFLPSAVSGITSWFYSALWTGEDFDFKNLNYYISGSRWGNRKIHFTSQIDKALYLTAGAAEAGTPGPPCPDKAAHPFPDPLPPELQQFTQPGTHIPASSPAVQNLLPHIIRPGSEHDMYKTVRDIIYSPRIQHIFLERAPEAHVQKKTPGGQTASLRADRDAAAVLAGRKAIRREKARLVCALARAAGIPARIVMSVEGAARPQFWISGCGWVSAETGWPVYNYIEPVRTVFPKPLPPSDQILSAISGIHDTAGPVLWNKNVNAYYARIEPARLKAEQRFYRSTVLCIKIGAGDAVPDGAKVPMDSNVYISARHKNGGVLLVVEDKNGKERSVMPIEKSGEQCGLRIGDNLLWQFIPRIIGDILVIENRQWLAFTNAG